MCRKLLLLMSFVVVLGLASNASAVFLDYTNVTASNAGNNYTDRGPEYTTDNSGMSTGGTHGTHTNAPDLRMWMGSGWDWKVSYSAGNTATGCTYIAYEFDAVYALLDTWVWNYNESGNTNRGTRKAEVALYDGSSWSTLQFTFAQADGSATYAGAAGPDLTGYSASVVVITRADGAGTGNWGASDDNSNFGRSGLSEIRFGIPEPATIALLGLGGLALLRRKR
jgi:hypothetical protein